MSTLDSRWREAGGFRLHVREGGVGDRVVLVHGLGVSGRYFEPLGRELARMFRVSIPDLPGWGGSERPARALTIEELADVVGDLIAHEGGAPGLIANSLGCQVVLALAERPSPASGPLVLIGPTVDPAYRGWVRHAIRLMIGATREEPRLMAVALRDYLRMGPRRTLATAGKALTDRPEQRLPHVDVPVLVVRGEHDALTSPTWARRCAALAPHGRFVEIEGAAHAAHASHPGRVAELVERFLAEGHDGVGQVIRHVDHRDVTGAR